MEPAAGACPPPSRPHRPTIDQTLFVGFIAFAVVCTPAGFFHFEDLRWLRYVVPLLDGHTASVWGAGRCRPGLLCVKGDFSMFTHRASWKRSRRPHRSRGRLRLLRGCRLSLELLEAR